MTMTPSWIDDRLISPVTLLNLTQTYDSLISHLQEHQQNGLNAIKVMMDDEANTTRLYDSLRNLYLACTLLVKIYNITSTAGNDNVTGGEDDTGDGDLNQAEIAHHHVQSPHDCIIILQQTARRCQLLIEVLRLSRTTFSNSTTTPLLDDNDDDTIHDMENVHVEEAHHARKSDHHHHQQALFSWDFSATIDLSGVELEAEEQSLVQMANTPIPTEQESSSSSSSSSAAAMLLEQERERLYANMRREWGADATCDERIQAL